MVESNERPGHWLIASVTIALDDYDPDEGATFVNEVMAEDDAKDPYLESYQPQDHPYPTS